VPQLQEPIRGLSSCGRTLFNLQTVTARVKSAPPIWKGVKIRHHGLHRQRRGKWPTRIRLRGRRPNKINLYVGKTPVKFNIPEGPRRWIGLVDLIRERGK